MSGRARAATIINPSASSDTSREGEKRSIVLFLERDKPGSGAYVAQKRAIARVLLEGG